jgi:hypothetical protein
MRTKLRTHFYPQQWLLCHMGLYYSKFKISSHNHVLLATSLRVELAAC